MHVDDYIKEVTRGMEGGATHRIVSLIPDTWQQTVFAAANLHLCAVHSEITRVTAPTRGRSGTR